MCAKIKPLLKTIIKGDFWVYECMGFSKLYIKTAVKRRINDMYRQEWCDDSTVHRACDYYSKIKNEHKFEKYLLDLNYNKRSIVAQFRSRSNYLPVHISKYCEITNDDITCPFCDLFLPGNESHYLQTCPMFSTTRDSLLRENVILGEKLYSNIDNLVKCIPLMEEIMLTCKEILT